MTYSTTHSFTPSFHNHSPAMSLLLLLSPTSVALFLALIQLAHAGCWTVNNDDFFYDNCSIEPWAAWLLFVAFWVVIGLIVFFIVRSCNSSRRERDRLNAAAMAANHQPQAQAQVPMGTVKGQQNVTIPFNAPPGSNIKVICSTTGKEFETTVPAGMSAGQTLSVQSPFS